MNWTVLILVCWGLVTGCASERQNRKDARNALIGAVGGAAVSAMTGNDPVKGAAIGAAAGVVLGRVVVDGRERQVYADGRGGRYWRDDEGRHHPLR